MTNNNVTVNKELVNKLSNIIKGYDPYTAYIDAKQLPTQPNEVFRFSESIPNRNEPYRRDSIYSLSVPYRQV